METTTTTTTSSTRIPPGFRFHPTEEELVGYYLLKKINSNIDQCHNLNVIMDIDLCTMEPWDILGKCCQGAYEEEQQQNEWYFFSHKGKKYPTGSRTNRATAAGFWKATGRDKPVLSKNQVVIGMRKTLVFYHGRAPNGKKTDWIIHEYRLQSYEHGPPQEEGWVVCRAFRKQSTNQPIYTSFLCHNNNPLQLKFVENYSSISQYPVEHPPEIDVSDYAKECFSTDWDISLDQLIELQVITDEHLLPNIL
ncbi:unnamed protein product [Rhodiola kirilowii]